MASGALVLLGCLGASACARPPPESEVRLETLKVEAKALDARLEGLEERLLGNQMRLHLWSELAARHRTVSAVACRAADEHVESIVRHFQKTEEVFNRRRRRAQRVASSPPPSRRMVEAGMGGPEGED